MSLAHGSLGRSTTRVCFDKVDASLISRPDLFLSLAEKLSVSASDVSAPEGGNKVHLSFPSEQDALKFTQGIVDLFQISESDNQVHKLISYSNERPTGSQRAAEIDLTDRVRTGGGFKRTWALSEPESLAGRPSAFTKYLQKYIFLLLEQRMKAEKYQGWFYFQQQYVKIYHQHLMELAALVRRNPQAGSPTLPGGFSGAEAPSSSEIRLDESQLLGEIASLLRVHHSSISTQIQDAVASTKENMKTESYEVTTKIDHSSREMLEKVSTEFTELKEELLSESFSSKLSTQVEHKMQAHLEAFSSSLVEKIEQILSSTEFRERITSAVEEKVNASIIETNQYADKRATEIVEKVWQFLTTSEFTEKKSHRLWRKRLRQASQRLMSIRTSELQKLWISLPKLSSMRSTLKRCRHPCRK
eukprot:RCo045987